MGIRYNMVLFAQKTPLGKILADTSYRDWTFSEFKTITPESDMVVISVKSEKEDIDLPIALHSDLTELELLDRIFKTAGNELLNRTEKEFKVDGIAGVYSLENFDIDTLLGLSDKREYRQKVQPPRADNPKDLRDKLEAIINRVEYKDWDFQVTLDESRPMLQIVFNDTDIDDNSDELVQQKSRKYVLSPYMTDSEVIQTALLATIKAEQHETREHFMYKGKRIFGPHLSVDARVDLVREAQGITGIQFSGNNKSGQKIIDVTPQKQTKNACGTTSLSMAMNYFKKKVTPAQLDAKIRTNPNNFSAPTLLVQEARANGLSSQMYNNGSFEKVKTMIDNDQLVIALIDARRRDMDVNAHYVLINGYDDSNSKAKKFYVTDPANGKSNWRSVEDFSKKWNDVQLATFKTGLKNFMIGVSTESNPVPRSNMDKKVQMALGMGELASKAFNLFGQLFKS